MEKFEINALNIKCEGCVNTIQTELLKINGISEVSASKINGLVSVSGIELDRDVIVKKLREIGYPER